LGSAGIFKSLNLSALNQTTWSRVKNAFVAGIIGGTASVIGGGKFSNGAVSGAFSRLFNDMKAGESELKYNDDIEAALKDLRKHPEFVEMERIAEKNLKHPVEIKLIRRVGGVFAQGTIDGTILIPKGWGKFNYYQVSKYRRVPFSLQRTIFHEMYHFAYTYGISDHLTHYKSTVVPTNRFMKANYGSPERATIDICTYSRC